jgi:hypothetical protein
MQQQTIKGLSISQPWAWLIANGHKDIENRNWATAYRGLVLLHSPLLEDQWQFSSSGRLLQTIWPEGADRMPQRKEDYQYGGFVGIAELVDVVRESNNPWFVGKYGLVFCNAHPIPFYPFRGQRYLFDVPATVASSVIMQEAS